MIIIMKLIEALKITDYVPKYWNDIRTFKFVKAIFNQVEYLIIYKYWGKEERKHISWCIQSTSWATIEK